MPNQAPPLTAAITAVGVLGGAYCAYQAYRRYNTVKLPEEWRQVGTLKDLYVYPIKSCGPVIVSEAECAILGLKDDWLSDRILMVVDEKDNFITARGYPDMLTVHPTVRRSILTLEHRDMEPVHVNLAEAIVSEKPKTAYVWGVAVPVLDCGKEAGEWFTRLLNYPDKLRLVYYASRECRKLRSKTNRVYKFTKNDMGALPDEVPFNLINQASVDDLNARLKDSKCSPRNFRPNFVLVGAAKAYDEDNWKFVKIGDNVFEIIKPCTRCVLTTIDPETGVRNPNVEPLETLKSYRQIEDPELRKSSGYSPRMGLQMALRSDPGGRVTLNDPIYVA